MRICHKGRNPNQKIQMSNEAFQAFGKVFLALLIVWGVLGFTILVCWLLDKIRKFK